MIHLLHNRSREIKISLLLIYLALGIFIRTMATRDKEDKFFLLSKLSQQQIDLISLGDRQSAYRAMILATLWGDMSFYRSHSIDAYNYERITKLFSKIYLLDDRSQYFGDFIISNYGLSNVTGNLLYLIVYLINFADLDPINRQHHYLHAGALAIKGNHHNWIKKIQTRLDNYGGP